MKRIIVLALILIVSMFVTTAIAPVTISIPRIDTASDQTLRIKNVDPFGDPIDGGPPGTYDMRL